MRLGSVEPTLVSLVQVTSYSKAGLEPEIDRREAQLGAAEHEGGTLEIVARMRPDRVDVTPGSLDGVVEEDPAATAGLDQAIDGADTPIGRLCGIPPIARPLGEGY